MAKLTVSYVSRMGTKSLPMHGTYQRLNLSPRATMEQVELAARAKLRSGHDSADALVFYAIMKRWHYHRQAGHII